MLPSAVADLQRSGITAEDAAASGLFDAEDASKIYPDFAAEPALVIPYYMPDGELATFRRDGETLPFCRVRYLEPKVRGGFTKQKVQRYAQPGKSGTRAYFAPMLAWSKLIEDTQEPLIITEGEKKAISAAVAGFPVIALGGVWRGRDVYICFDSDAALNPNILAAEARLVDELQRKRGARCYLVRLPQDGDNKVGLDDFLQTYGAAAFTALLANSPSLGALDAKVVSLNKSCAWIEKEGMVYDLEERDFIKKDNFVTGSRFSALKHITVGGKQRSAPKEISIAQKWLTHPHAQRFGEILFRPGEGPTVTSDKGRPALNMWNGWNAENGVRATDKRVATFLFLTDFLFRNLPATSRDLPLKLMAYKAQNPQDKVPLSLVLIGDQGCGKSLWGECLASAFAPYSVAIASKAFGAEFQGWMEKSVFAVINEAEALDMKRYGEALKSLISDLKRQMNEKFRPQREINSYTMYMLTANDRAVGSFAADDRRMIVVDCPKPMQDDELYMYLGRRHGTWHAENGPAALMGYLLELDLKGWRPPLAPPMTAEKYQAFRESLTQVQELATDMENARGENAVRLWLDSALSWAREGEVSNNPALAGAARATLDGMKHMQIRPWYEPRELALLFPNLIATVLGGKYDRSTAPGQISRELRNAGVPYLKPKDDPRGFLWKGVVRQYLVVCDRDEWSQPLSQEDFERYMAGFSAYGRR
jgi:hypothetical protein